MDQSREKLQQRISQEIKDRPLQELLRDLTDSAWKWRQGDQAVVTTDRWITVGGQTVRGTTAQEKAATTTGGQTDSQSQTTSPTKGEKGDTGPRGPAGADGKDGKDGKDGADGAMPSGGSTGYFLEGTGMWAQVPMASVIGLTEALAGKEPILSTGTSLQYLRGDKTWQTLNTSVVPEGTNLYYSNARVDARISAQKGAPSGIATLDTNTKIPLAQIPDALIGQVKFQSLWNQTTNSPTLPATPAAGTKGYYWICTDAAQATFQGLVLNTGDWLIVNGNEGSLSWGKVDNTDSVTSVFGRTGAVAAQASDYSAYYQPLDSDLTAIAALTTTAFGRSLLTVADAAAARTAIGAQVAGSYQASSSVLTSIAAQSSGTGLLKLTSGVASLDSTAYATASSLENYLPLSGGTLTGSGYILTINSTNRWSGLRVCTGSSTSGAYTIYETPTNSASAWAVQKRDSADYGTSVGCFAIEEVSAGLVSARFPLWIAAGASGAITMTRALIGTTASFSGNVTAPSYYFPINSGYVGSATQGGFLGNQFNVTCLRPNSSSDMWTGLSEGRKPGLVYRAKTDGGAYANDYQGWFFASSAQNQATISVGDGSSTWNPKIVMSTGSDGISLFGDTTIIADNGSGKLTANYVYANNGLSNGDIWTVSAGTTLTLSAPVAGRIRAFTTTALDQTAYITYGTSSVSVQFVPWVGNGVAIVGYSPVSASGINSWNLSGVSGTGGYAPRSIIEYCISSTKVLLICG